MRLIIAVALAAGLPLGFARAEQPLTDTLAFEHADAASFYDMDACGDDMDGRLFRRALMDKFLHCPFAETSRDRFKVRIAAQQRLSRTRLQSVIDTVGGLPTQLPGMARTCREQISSPEYQHLRDALQHYASGELSAADILPESCDAADFGP